jgi:FkbM family methyltransferase
VSSAERMFWREVRAVPAAGKLAVLAHHIARRLGLGGLPWSLRATLAAPAGADRADPPLRPLMVRILTSTQDLGPDIGIWDQVVSDYFRLPQFLPQDGAVVVDVGANVGLYTLLVSLLARDVVVHAFEPMPHPFERLVANCRFNDLKGVRCQNVALSDSSGGRRRMYAADGSVAARALQGTFDEDVSRRAPPARRNSAIDVPEMRFDDYAASERIPRVHLMKIDVEGSEQRVLAGMAGASAIVERIVLEWHGTSRRQWCDAWMQGHGFVPVAVGQSHGVDDAVGLVYYVRQGAGR